MPTQKKRRAGPHDKITTTTKNHLYERYQKVNERMNAQRELFPRDSCRMIQR